jgi:hypothetical protein
MPQKLTPEIILAAIEGFKSQKRHLDSQIAELQSMLSGDHTESTAIPSETGKPKGKFSAATRRKMAAAQRARYAKLKQSFEPPRLATPETSKPKRKVSKAARARMAAAQKARWAKVKKASGPQLAVAKKGAAKKAA